MIANLVYKRNWRAENEMTYQGEKGTIHAEQTPSRVKVVDVVIPQEEAVLIAQEIDGMVANLREITRIIETGNQDRYLEK